MFVLSGIACTEAGRMPRAFGHRVANAAASVGHDGVRETCACEGVFIISLFT